MSSKDHIVFIVDDDRRIRESLVELLSTFDMNVASFGSATDYLAYPKPEVSSADTATVDRFGTAEISLN